MDTTAIVEAVATHAEVLGIFETPVLRHEPKSAPGVGIHLAVFGERLTPVRSSGLASVSGRLVLTARIYISMLMEPQDAIDPLLFGAADALFTAYCGDFELGGLIRQVDIFGAHGVGLDCDAGYGAIDSKVFRIADITLPLIINDIWTEAP